MDGTLINQGAQVALQTQNNADHIWVLVATALVLFMQAGFLLLEAGATRSKNSISVAQKNLVDLCVSICAFYVIGFAVMFGPSLGWIGWSSDLIAFPSADSWTLAFFAFQAVFAGTAATIMSGAVAERMQFSAYVICALLLAGVFYPIFGHWAWGNLLLPENPAWLADRGFLDFAGSTVVHSAGGWFALAAIFVLGARHDRFDAKGKPKQLNGHSPILSGAGAVILLFGWFGFNAGSTVAATADVAMILANTLLAATFGGSSGVLIGRAMDGLFLPSRAINGLLGGLVGITAGCAFVDLQGAVLIGAICGCLVVLSEEALLRVFKLDDVVGAIAVHGVCGAAGTLLLALFAMPEHLAAGGRFAQFVVQAEGVALAFVWFGGGGLAVCYPLKWMGKLRVSLEDEQHGLNLSEHGVQMTTGTLQEALARIALVDRDLTQRLPADGGDESAEMAAILNPFLNDMQKSLTNVRGHAEEVTAASTQLLTLSRDFAEDSAGLHSASAQMVGESAKLTTSASAARSVVADVNDQANLLAGKATNMASDMTDLAQTVRDMAATISEINGEAAKARQSSKNAFEQSSDSLHKIASLAQTTEAVDEVLGRIREISDKTILLALNARVEAARSGTAGRGFAIVAQEVAELSRQTQTAADQITTRIKEMKNGSLHALDGMRSVSAVLGELTEDMRVVNDATLRQDAAVTQLGAVAAAGAQMAQDVSSGVVALREGTSRIAEFTDEVSQSSAEANQIANRLQQDAARGNQNADSLAQSSTTLAQDSERLGAASRRYRA